MTKTLEINNFTFESNAYRCEDIEDTVDISCVATSQDHWHSDEVIECDISKEDAVKLIHFLKDAFSIS